MRNQNSRPVNRTAAAVVSRGEHHEYTPHHDSTDSDLPIPFGPPSEDHLATPGFEDLTGRISGRLRVLGVSLEKKKRWVCRCQCGAYTLRRAVAIISGGGAHCDKCHLFLRAKCKDIERRTGILINTEDMQ